jgi:hypothetical protein
LLQKLPEPIKAFHGFRAVKIFGGFKHEVQRALVIDETPLRVF